MMRALAVRLLVWLLGRLVPLHDLTPAAKVIDLDLERTRRRGQAPNLPPAA